MAYSIHRAFGNVGSTILCTRTQIWHGQTATHGKVALTRAAETDERGEMGGREVTAFRIVGASEDPGGPRLVGRRLVALRQDLAALAAPPALDLHTRRERERATRSDRVREARELRA